MTWSRAFAVQRRPSALYIRRAILIMMLSSLSCDAFQLHKRVHRRIRRWSSPLDDFLADNVLHPRFLSTSVDEKTCNATDSLTNRQWRKIDWKSVTQNDDAFSIEPSPVQLAMIRNRVCHIKRDDLIKLPGSHISGNKARKLWSAALYPSQDFPACVVSYGGPQSNAMLAMAAVVHHHNQQRSTQNSAKKSCQFVYYTRTLPKFLRTSPSGNLFRAQSLGAEVVEVPPAKYAALFGDETTRHEPPGFLEAPIPGDSLWIPQGGSSDMAVVGCERLAHEIIDYWQEKGRDRPLTVCLAGGTCTTAALVHMALQQDARSASMDIQLVVVPCVGDASYAQRQMIALYEQVGANNVNIPLVLPSCPVSNSQSTEEGGGYLAFGEPSVDILDTYNEMKDRHDLPLDLLYGAPAWTILLRHWREMEKNDDSSPLAPDREIMYVHSGGLEGVNTQLLRYKFKGLVSLEDIQIPPKAA